MRSRIVVLVGLPGSGKSTWAQQAGGGILSSDAIRELISDDPTNQKIHARTFAVLRHLLRERLELRRPVTYIDATNLTPYERRPYVTLANLYDCEIEAVFFDVPVDECQRRNRMRHRIVPDDVIGEMARRLVPPTTAEGFNRVIVVA
jgi:predicted kinase